MTVEIVTVVIVTVEIVRVVIVTVVIVTVELVAVVITLAGLSDDDQRRVTVMITKQDLTRILIPDPGYDRGSSQFSVPTIRLDVHPGPACVLLLLRRQSVRDTML